MTYIKKLFGYSKIWINNLFLTHHLINLAKKNSPKFIFISFKTEERSIAFSLKTALEKANYKVWWQEDLQLGQEWHGELDNAVAQADAIIVLWSKLSIESPWVKHEASQAIVRNIYTPVRIEPLAIPSPFNRIQATDIFEWNKLDDDPGFQHVIKHLEGIMPKRVPIYKKIPIYIWKNRLNTLFLLITIGALTLLFWQRQDLKNQIEKQRELIDSVNVSLNLLKETKDGLANQYNELKKLGGDIDSASNLISGQTDLLKSETKNILDSTRSTIDSISVAIDTIGALKAIQEYSISRIVRLDTSLEKSSKTLNSVLSQTTTNLNSLNNLVDYTTNLALPLAPIKFTISIKYKLERSLLSMSVKEYKEFTRNIESSGFEVKESLLWLSEENFNNSKKYYPSSNAFGWLTNWEELRDEFYRMYNFDFKFFSDSLGNDLLLSYCNDHRSFFIENLQCGIKEDNIYYQWQDSTLVRELSYTFNDIPYNLGDLKNLNDLLLNCYIKVDFEHNGKFNYNLTFIERGFSSLFQEDMLTDDIDLIKPKNKYTRVLEFKDIYIDPKIKINYGSNLSLSKTIERENLFYTKMGNKPNPFNKIYPIKYTLYMQLSND